MARAGRAVGLCGAALLAAMAVAGCSTGDETPVPVECRTSPEGVRRALQSAPDPVTLDGTPISDCFTPSSNPADVQALGIAITEASAQLSADAQARPEGDAALELGYLLGAVRRGSAATQGIHRELVRRVEQEAARVDMSSEAFTIGERAGRESG